MFSPILHTMWLDNLAMTLKSNSAQYYLVKIQTFAYLRKIFSWIKENLSQVQKIFTFHATSALKKEISMYAKPVMPCFKYQVCLYGSEAITYLEAILWVVTEPTLWVCPHPPPPTPHYR